MKRTRIPIPEANVASPPLHHLPLYSVNLRYPSSGPRSLPWSVGSVPSGVNVFHYRATFPPKDRGVENKKLADNIQQQPAHCLIDQPPPERERARFSWELQANNEHRIGGRSPPYFRRIRMALVVCAVNKFLGTYYDPGILKREGF